MSAIENGEATSMTIERLIRRNLRALEEKPSNMIEIIDGYITSHQITSVSLPFADKMPSVVVDASTGNVLVVHRRSLGLASLLFFVALVCFIFGESFSYVAIRF